MTRIPYSDVFYQQATRHIGQLGEKLMDRALMLGAAESCTGGLLSALCTELPGSSAWFAGGVVSYANSVKREVLGVREELLEKHGAVSREVVEAMAAGVLRALGVEVGIAISGIAGPGGGTDEKPVGTVWLGLATRSQGTVALRSRRYVFPGSRQDVRSAAVAEALNMLGEAPGGAPGEPSAERLGQ